MEASKSKGRISPVKLSQEFLNKMKMGEEAGDLIPIIAKLNFGELKRALSENAVKMAFWINLYNAFSIYLLQKDAGITEKGSSRLRHFLSRQINVAGKPMSLNDIEHGILRRSRIWWSKGYLSKWWVSAFEKALRVEVLDPRIHFALNCGGMSCPPIRFYDSDRLEAQLQLATESFLKSEVKLLGEQGGEVEISAIFNWYIGDFGGKKGLLKFLEEGGAIPSGSRPAIRYAPYHWKADLEAFV